MNKLVAMFAIGAVAVLLRKQLVHVLTKTTGTWVGTPDA
jgi:hypothetical protein